MSCTVQELLSIGEQIGLQGEELKEFIREQQEAAREERKKEREEKEKEREEKEKDRETQLKLKEFEMEKERLRLSEEMRRIELQARLEEFTSRSRVTGELDTDVEQEGEAIRSTGAVSGLKIRGSKMSPFDDRDYMDSYLHRFERYAELQGWKRDVRAAYLSALLKGTALDVYARLPPDQSKDYEILKTALLKRYALTEEGYKSKFYESKPEKGESPQQFIIRLENYFMRWLDLAKVEHTFDGVRALMVRERYLATCSRALELFLRERESCCQFTRSWKVS